MLCAFGALVFSEASWLLHAAYTPCADISWSQVRYDPDSAGPRHLLQAVEDAGFDAQLMDSNRCAAATVALRLLTC